MWSVSKAFFILAAVSCVFLFGVTAVIIARSAKSWKTRFQEYKYRKSLYPKQKEKSGTASLQLFVVLASALIIVAVSAPRISVSAVLVGFAATFYILYDEILGGGFTCSVNFRNKLSSHRCCRLTFKQVDDGSMIMFDDQIAVVNAFIALLPCSFFGMIVSVLTHFFNVDLVALVLIFAFYCARIITSCFYFLKIKNSGSRFRATLFFILHVAGVICFVITTIRLPIELAVDPSIYSKAGEVYANIFVLLLVTSVGLLSCIDCLFYKSVVSLSYPVIPEEDDNYLEVKLKNGDIFDSTEQFFYPVKHKEYIKLLFVDNSSVVIADEDIDYFVIHGFGENEKDTKTIVL